jgi:hypothetical protein
MRLRVDATDLEHHIVSVSDSLPVQGGGQVTLLYPQWLPGSHSPTGRVDKLAGLVIRAGGARVDWTRDSVDVYAFHVTVPAAATTLDIDF